MQSGVYGSTGWWRPRIVQQVVYSGAVLIRPGVVRRFLRNCTVLWPGIVRRWFYSTALWRLAIARWSLGRSNVALQQYSLVAGQSRSGTPSLRPVTMICIQFASFLLKRGFYMPLENCIINKAKMKLPKTLQGEGHVGFLSGISQTKVLLKLESKKFEQVGR